MLYCPDIFSVAYWGGGGGGGLLDPAPPHPPPPPPTPQLTIYLGQNVGFTDEHAPYPFVLEDSSVHHCIIYLPNVTGGGGGGGGLLDPAPSSPPPPPPPKLTIYLGQNLVGFTYEHAPTPPSSWRIPRCTTALSNRRMFSIALL